MIRVDIQYPLRAGAWGRAVTTDLSASGAYVRCEPSFPLKAQVGCRIYVPPAGGEPDRLIDTDALIVRVDAPEPGIKEWRYGLYFLALNEPDLQALRRFIFATI